MWTLLVIALGTSVDIAQVGLFQNKYTCEEAAEQIKTMERTNTPELVIETKCVKIE